MGQLLVLDLDETLIANNFMEAHPSSHIQVMIVPNEYGFIDRVILRPYAHEFLSWCETHFEHIVLATFSPEERADTVLRELGIREHFDLIVSRHILEFSKGLLLLGGDPDCSYDFGGDFCLVDDQDWDSDHVLIKMNFFGVDVRPVVAARLAKEPLEGFSPIDDRFIQAPDYEGNPDDSFFLDLLNAFKENYIPDECEVA